MTPLDISRPDPVKIMAGLKDFQRDTVDYVFKRLYTDPDATSRFLIADEVGLGKTLVARGVIAKAVDHLWNDGDRIDIIYICSNQEIAQQNIDRLNITQDRTFQHASRATLLPITLHKLQGNRLNFVSLTPGTSFNLSSQAGWVWERVILFFLLRKAWRVSEASLSNILRGDVLYNNWNGYLNGFDQKSIDEELAVQFISSLHQHPDLRHHFSEIAKEVGPRRRNLDWEMRSSRNSLLGALRRLLAKSSLAALEPDLIILDEFQRFKYLLNDDNEYSLLAKELFDYKNPDGKPAKVLLLSATPYKMYTLQGEDENHYQDFIDTTKFLLNGQTVELVKLEENLDDYRRAYLGWGVEQNSVDAIQRAKNGIESVLRKVMVRTERLAVSNNRNGMLTEELSAQDQMHPDDLVAFVELDHLAGNLGVGNQVEYWKSSSYPLNLMENYKLKRVFQDALKKTDDDLFTILEKYQPHLLHWDNIQKYQEIDSGNARLRDLMNRSFQQDSWKLLWLPANLPYYLPEGPFASEAGKGFTKSLVFSAWQVVPKVISILLSYEAERRILSNAEQDFDYDTLMRKRPPLLRFSISRGRKTGLSAFTLLYPCLTLASEFDPIQYAKQSEESTLSSSFYMLARIKTRIRQLMDQATEHMKISTNGPIDESWYWFSPFILDRFYFRKSVESWLFTDNSNLAWESMLQIDLDDEDGSAFAEHVDEFKQAFSHLPKLGRQPSDLIDVLALMALAGPSITLLRSLLRVTGVDRNKVGADFLSGAARGGLGFRSLFNQPDAISLLRQLYSESATEESAYWKLVLQYCLQGNIQAVLDEYLHILLESLGLVDHDAGECAEKIGKTVRQSLSLRSPNLRFDEIRLNKRMHEISMDEHSIRCRYALRFGSEQGEKLAGGSRDTDVRVAFNSPFRPFVLATTSVGQEGLDFHQYCHRVVHWNLPSNPVDLEQREGRVHRYKGHVVRRNLVSKYGLKSLKLNKDMFIDPWKQIFELACQDRGAANDLVPYWIFENESCHGPYHIERLIPILPLSREINRLELLKKALVAYRSVIGQPRQQELLETISDRVSSSDLKDVLSKITIDLSPPNLNFKKDNPDRL